MMFPVASRLSGTQNAPGDRQSVEAAPVPRNPRTEVRPEAAGDCRRLVPTVDLESDSLKQLLCLVILTLRYTQKLQETVDACCVRYLVHGTLLEIDNLKLLLWLVILTLRYIQKLQETVDVCLTGGRN
nr:hypothetical protein BaRGS_030021 [Batillaria attramentaria]